MHYSPQGRKGLALADYSWVDFLIALLYLLSLLFYYNSFFSKKISGSVSFFSFTSERKPEATLKACLTCCSATAPERNVLLLNISLPCWPGSEQTWMVLCSGSLPLGLLYLITLASGLIWDLTPVAVWFLPHGRLAWSFCFWQELVMGPYLSVNVSVSRGWGVDYWWLGGLHGGDCFCLAG